MNKIIFSIISTTFIAISAFSQVTNDFELGSRNAYIADCWTFLSTNVNGGNNSINGNFAMRSGQMSNLENPHTLLSPWVDVTSGNITFDTKLTALNGGGKFLDVVLIDENDNVITLLEHEYTSAAVAGFSVPVNVTGVYKVGFLLYGQGGNSRGIIDDVSIPGTYAADPGNNCSIFLAITDTDSDGIADEEDDYPNDPAKAYNNFSNTAGSYNTLAFEDLWPSQGDYDFNDLVVDYRFNEITNADNNVVQIEATFYVRAVGGSLNNGFAIQIDDLSPSDIASVTGQQITGNLFTISANGTEAGQSTAVIPIFDSPENVINRVGGSMYNTIPANGTGVSDTFTVVITLNTPIANVGTAPYNPFLIKDQVRGTEIHLPDMLPTSLADTSLFGTGQDDTSPGTGKYYKTENNLPWALIVDTTFQYPIEGADILSAYLNFAEWAQSDGENFPDWYSNSASGYRDSSNIYN
jgi:LruC domain-containing protein